MFKKLEKVGKRRGTKPVKILYRLEVNNVVIKNATNFEGKEYVSCCFERGDKIVATTDEICRPQMDGNAEVYFDKTLSLVATMYQDRDGKFLEKFGKFVFRMKTKSGSYKGLGVYEIPLHYYATRYQPVDEIFVLSKCAYDGITAHVTMTPKILDNSADDTGSDLSGCTDHTTGAADFSGHMSDAGSDMGDGEDDYMMDRSVNRARTASFGSDCGSTDDHQEDVDGLMKSKSAPILTSTTSKPKGASPLPPTTTQTAGSYANLRTLTPIMSSDSIDEEPPQPHGGRGSPHLNTNQRRASREAPIPVDHTLLEARSDPNSLITESDMSEEDEAVGKKKKQKHKDKLLVSQESSDTLITPGGPSQTKPKSSWGILCCLSASGTTDAVIRGASVQPPIHETPSKSSSTSRASKTQSGKKSQTRQQEMNTSRGKSDPRSIDGSIGKSSSSHGKKTITDPVKGKKPKSLGNSGGSLSGSSHGGSSHGVGGKKSSTGEAKPAWLN